MQFADAMVLLLLAAAVVSFLGGESLGGVIIVSIVALNGGFGAFAEGRAQEALWVVRALLETKATVVRDGRPCEIGRLRRSGWR